MLKNSTRNIIGFLCKFVKFSHHKWWLEWDYVYNQSRIGMEIKWKLRSRRKKNETVVNHHGGQSNLKCKYADFMKLSIIFLVLLVFATETPCTRQIWPVSTGKKSLDLTRSTILKILRPIKLCSFVRYNKVDWITYVLILQMNRYK